MWRRIYLGLLVVRLYFALCPSYIHPDEHFQGPEIVAGEYRASKCLVRPRCFMASLKHVRISSAHKRWSRSLVGDVFNWQVTKTWEFTVSTPIRSIFPLWAVYGLPMQILQWITTSDSPSPTLIYYTLRILFSLASFVLGKKLGKPFH